MPGYRTGFWESSSQLWFGAGDFFCSVNFVGSWNVDLREASLSPCASVDAVTDGSDGSLQQDLWGLQAARGRGCWQRGPAQAACFTAPLSAVTGSPQKVDGLVSTASTGMSAWLGEASTGGAAATAYVSLYFKSREKGSVCEPHHPWCPLDTPNCWVGNQNKRWQLHKHNKGNY